MNTVSLSGDGLALTGATVVPDSFLAEYMPGANGEFVKVYLAALLLAQKNRPVTAEALSDLLAAPVSSIERALSYWQKQGLLCLSQADSSASAFAAASVSASTSASVSVSASAPASASASEAAPDICSKADPDLPLASGQMPNAAGQVADVSGSGAAGQSNVILMRARSQSPETVTSEQVSHKLTDPNFSMLIKLAESLLHCTLKSDDINRLIYFQDILHLSDELIEYLFNLAVERGKKSFRYMQAIAESWHDQGITTVEAAEAESKQHSGSVRAVSEAFALNRALAPEELRFVTRWVSEYNMNDECITEACNRTIVQVHEPAFAYTDSILRRWHEEGVHDKTTMELSDKAFKQKAETERAKKEASYGQTSGTSGAMRAAGGRRQGFAPRPGTSGDFAQRTNTLDAILNGYAAGKNQE